MNRFTLCLLISVIGLSLWGCQPSTPSDPILTLTEAEKRLPEHALHGLDLAPGLEATLFASEPMMLNPTNMDIDDRGRVWVCEAFNYRNHLNPNNPEREAGDRILILEDSDGDGVADKSKVFYQGTDINSALGIGLIGNQVVISVSPNVLVFTDEDGDDVPDKKEVLFTGMEGVQHDHGAHAFVFGPDGKWYFNFGNEGKRLLWGDESPVLDQLGRPIQTGGKPYRQGMAFRYDPAKKEVEVLAHNFRNNYELAPDAFGTIWQSDNDDDGNQGTRINYVMQHGNFGFRDEKTGAGWRAVRTGMSDSVPLRHWHLNDPGVVPNLLQTGAGSPTGLLIYEGDLLPEVFHNQIIHCDAGPNVVRSYPVANSGAGYSAEIVNLVKGTRDNWFRPSDVCVAPDGSLFIADWYDPGVGGHQMGDTARGRIIRLAPEKGNYRLPEQDYSAPAGAALALTNPNVAVRAKAWMALHDFGPAAEAELKALWKGEHPRLRARALWLLSRLPVAGESYLQLALQDPNPNLRITGLRIAQQMEVPLLPILQDMAMDSSVQVRREVALALRFEEGEAADQTWVQLAEQAPEGDRWYLEALGIGADLFAAKRFAAWQAKVGNDWQTPQGKALVWRMKTPAALPLLAELIAAASSPEETVPYFRAMDFYPEAARQPYLERLSSGDHPQQAELTYFAIRGMNKQQVLASPEIRKQLNGLLASLIDTNPTAYLDLVEDLELAEENEGIFQIAMAHPTEPLGNRASSLLRRFDGIDLFTASLRSEDPTEVMAAISSLESVSNDQSIDLLQRIVLDDTQPMHLRKMAIQAMGSGWHGESRLEEWLTSEPEISQELLIAGATRLLGANRTAIRETAFSLLDIDQDAETPDVEELLALGGNSSNGMAMFQAYCSSCHIVHEAGVDFGPNLSEIGSKLSKPALFASIINPSAGISFGYEGYLIQTKDEQKYLGYLSSQTEDEITLRVAGGTDIRLQRSQIAQMQIQDQSLMTPGLHQVMDAQQLADLVAYLESLKKPDAFAME